MTDTGASTRERSRKPNPAEHGKWLSALIALIGAWLVLEAVIVDLAEAQLWNDLFIGVLLFAVGGYNFYRQMNEEHGSVGAAGMAALIGLWLVVSPFVFGAGMELAPIADNVGSLNNITVGLVTVVLGAFSAYRIRGRRTSDVRATPP